MDVENSKDLLLITIVPVYFCLKNSTYKIVYINVIRDNIKNTDKIILHKNGILYIVTYFIIVG